MQMTQAIALRKEWIRYGNGQCSHPQLDKEYYLGDLTGAYVCMTCGQSGAGPNWRDQKVKPVARPVRTTVKKSSAKTARR